MRVILACFCPADKGPGGGVGFAVVGSTGTRQTVPRHCLVRENTSAERVGGSGRNTGRHRVEINADISSSAGSGRQTTKQSTTRPASDRRVADNLNTSSRTRAWYLSRRRCARSR